MIGVAAVASCSFPIMIREALDFVGQTKSFVPDHRIPSVDQSMEFDMCEDFYDGFQQDRRGGDRSKVRQGAGGRIRSLGRRSTAEMVIGGRPET